MTKEKNEKLMFEIMEYLKKHNMFFDVGFYTNGKMYTNVDGYTRTKGEVKKHNGIEYVDWGERDVTEYVKYNNPSTVTMTFEGGFYEEFNYGNGQAFLEGIAEKYGLYPEQGYAWSVTFYEI